MKPREGALNLARNRRKSAVGRGDPSSTALPRWVI